MQRRQQKPGRDADGLLHVVVLDFVIVGESVVHAENDDQVGHGFKRWFLPIGAEGLQRGKPFVWKAACVVFFFLGFGSQADLPFQRRIRDDDKMPRLLVGTARSGCGDADGGLDQRERNRFVGEVADRTA